MSCCCGLGATCLTPDIQGVGSGPFLIVGQNPGAKEDLAGEPFVGKSGTLLRSMLHDAGFRTGDYRLTNAVRCHTPDNRPPTSAEVDACRTRLVDEVRREQPKIIVALGDCALRALTKMGGLRGKRGQSVPLHKDFGYDCEVWPTYHPAFVLRFPQNRRHVVADLTRIRRAHEPAGTVPYTLIRGEVFPILRVSPTVGPTAYDIETSYWWDGKDDIIQLGLANRVAGNTVARGDNVADWRSALRNVRPLVGHNSWAFDDKLTGLESDYDTMALAYLDDESQPLGLEACAVRYLGVAGWKDARGEVGRESDEFAQYNARDAHYTLLLFETLRQSLGERIRLSDCILRPAHKALLECSRRGVWISAEAVVRARSYFAAEAERLRCRQRALTNENFNPNSPPQVAEALLAEGHWLSSTDSGKPSTAEGVLAGLRQTPLVESLRAYRKAAKAISSFVTPYQRVVEGNDGRVHPDYTLLRTATGRTSARRLNIQQVSRDPLIRAFLSAPPGMELWSYDYSAIEFVLAGFVAGEDVILSNYAENPLWDPHTYMGNIIGSSRQVAKSANYGLLYGAHPPTFQEYCRKSGVDITLDEAASVRSAWLATFPGIPRWHKAVLKTLQRQEYIETFTGRRRHFGDPTLRRGARTTDAVREAANCQVQGPAADIALLGLVACHQADLPINGFYHDSITFEFEEGKGESMREEIERCMTEYPKQVLREQFGVDLTVPLRVDGKRVA